MHEKTGRELAAMRRHQAPNLVILSRAADPPIARLRRDDDLAEAQEKAPGDLGGSTEGTKRELRGMSAKSSLSVARVLSSLDWAKNGQCIHVTATYWHKWPTSKRDLQLEKQGLVQRLARYVECGIWRLEYQRRETAAEKALREAMRRPRIKGQGSLCVPHWHWLLWLGGRDLAEFESWLRPWWIDFSGNTSERGIEITQGDQARGTWYLAMHAAKREQSPPFAVGRWWGYINREALLAAQDLHETGEITERERVWWARLYRRSTGCRTRNAQGISWFLPRAWQCAVDQWVRDHIEFERIVRMRARPPF
jgi:hypothetical protein